MAEARAKREKLDLDAKLVAQQIEIEVADAQSALQIARERLALVKEELALTEKLESGERIRYEKGEGTLFLLNQRERATAEVMAK
ncbi:TolC family protein, partial [Vibrio parahaemolyticus]